MWRCPHCGTPQAETSRCWVCKRSSTSCGTCRHFRQSIAGGIGYCGLDPRRQALRGDELRGCWEAGPSFETPPTAPVREFSPTPRRLDFVPVEQASGSIAVVPAATPATPAAGPASVPPSDPLLGFWAEER